MMDTRYCHTSRRYTELITSRIVAKQRTLEIARYGYSTIEVPETNIEQAPKKSLFFRKRRGREYVRATLLLMKTLEREQTRRYNIEFKIHHDARMAKQRLLRGELLVGSACMAMKKVLISQQEYICILKRIAAINALRYNLVNGLIRGKDVPSNLKDILSITTTPRPTRESSSYSLEEDEVLYQLEHGNFFPILDTRNGKISFTESYDEISRLHHAGGADDDDYFFGTARNKSLCTTTTAKNGSSSRLLLLLLSKQESATTVCSSSCDSSAVSARRML